MGKSIYRVEDDKYVLFSSIVDDVTHYNLTREDVYEAFREEAIYRANRETDLAFERVDKRGTSSHMDDEAPTPQDAWQSMADTYNLNAEHKLTWQEFRDRLE